MRPIIINRTARLATLMLLAVLLGVGLQPVVVAENNTMTISVGTVAGAGIEDPLGTDPTIHKDVIPGVGGKQYYHTYTHYSPLIKQDRDGNVIPWMAESFEVSDDYRTISFHLRKGVKFADGTPFNASVAKFNLDRILTYGYKKWLSNAQYPVGIYYDYSEAVDEETLKVHFTQGWLDIAFDLCYTSYNNFISPSDVEPAWDIKGVLKPEKKYNGLGGYYLMENESVPKQKVVLERRHCWRDDLDFHNPKLNKIVLTLIDDPQTAVIALENGDIDYICRYWNVPIDELPRLAKNPKITIKTYPEAKMYYIATAYWKEPFNGTDGILLRKAICYALNRTEIADGALHGYAVPATDSMGLSPRFRPDVPECCQKGYGYDMEKARELLSEAGWTDVDGDGFLDKNGRALKDINFVITSEFPGHKDMAMMIQTQLEKLGIGVIVQTMDYETWKKTGKTGEYDLKLIYYMGRFFSSARDLRSFNAKALFGDSINVYNDQNGTLETVVTDAQKAASRSDHDEYLCKACGILHEDAGIIPLVYDIQYAVMSNKVKGFEFGPTANMHQLDPIDECEIAS